MAKIPHLTPRETDTLEIIIDFFLKRGRAPTLTFLAEKMVIERVTVPKFLSNLEEKGYIKRQPYGSHIEVLRDMDGSPVRIKLTAELVPRD